MISFSQKVYMVEVSIDGKVLAELYAKHGNNPDAVFKKIQIEIDLLRKKK